MIVYDLDSMNNGMPFLYCSTISLAVQIFWFVAKPIVAIAWRDALQNSPVVQCSQSFLSLGLFRN